MRLLKQLLGSKSAGRDPYAAGADHIPASPALIEIIDAVRHNAAATEKISFYNVVSHPGFSKLVPGARRHFVRTNLSEFHFTQHELELFTTGINLKGADLSGSVFDGITSFDNVIVDATTNFTNATFSNLDSVKLELHDADLTYAHFVKAKQVILELDGNRSLKGLDLSNTYLAKLSLTKGADASGILLSGARVLEMHAYGGILDGADMKGATIVGSLASSSLVLANFEGCNLREVDFGAADLTQAKFEGADISGANFSGADLRGTQLTAEALEARGARIDANTRFGELKPDGLQKVVKINLLLESLKFKRPRESGRVKIPQMHKTDISLSKMQQVTQTIGVQPKDGPSSMPQSVQQKNVLSRLMPKAGLGLGHPRKPS